MVQILCVRIMVKILCVRDKTSLGEMSGKEMEASDNQEWALCLLGQASSSPNHVRGIELMLGRTPTYRYHQSMDLCLWITRIWDGYQGAQLDLEALGGEQRNMPKTPL